MTYTEQRQQGKSLRVVLTRVRLFFVRLWLRSLAPRWTVGVLCLLRDKTGRVCLLRHKGRVKPWGMPGGIIEWPEAPEAGLIRELNEELGWQPAHHDVFHKGFRLLGVLHSDKFPLLDIVFEGVQPVESGESAGWTRQTSEIDAIAWFSLREIEELDGILERHRNFLLGVLRGK
jgi:8-oxo-dGTP pyrophosphatase MutT (NUDIX family)